MAYLLDANVFIEAKNRYYGFDLCPGFWEWLIAANRARRVFSIEKVENELTAGADELSDWAAERGADFFLKPDAKLLPALGQVATWANGQNYLPAAVSTFLQGADYYLVAHALANGDDVVCHEIPSGSKKRIKIPDACIALGVKVVSPFEMLRHERARFVLEPGSRQRGAR